MSETWMVEHGPDWIGVKTVDADGTAGTWVAKVHPIEPEFRKQALARATLIAAAPMMAVALRIARDRIHAEHCGTECVPDCEIATEAIITGACP